MYEIILERMIPDLPWEDDDHCPNCGSALNVGNNHCHKCGWPEFDEEPQF